MSCGIKGVFQDLNLEKTNQPRQPIEAIGKQEALRTSRIVRSGEYA
jgi:hypothetical protein